jgi:hypothetical protein
MPDDLYTADILRWSDQQAELLRRLARGERVNDAIDWENLIEEVESVGRSERQAVESLLTRAVEHLLKLRGWPNGPAAKWRHETSVFLLDARQRYSPSMGPVLNLPVIYASAVALINTMTYRSRPPRTLPERCPFTLSALIAPAPGLPDIDALLAALNRLEPG